MLDQDLLTADFDLPLPRQLPEGAGQAVVATFHRWPSGSLK